MFQTMLAYVSMVYGEKSQSPQVGAMFQTILKVLKAIGVIPSQSPQVGAMFQTHPMEWM